MEIKENSYKKIVNCTFDIPDIPSQDKIEYLSIDTESMGLQIHRDRLCVIQILINNKVYVVHFPKPEYNKSPNLKKLLSDNNIIKIFHFARFDIGMIFKYLGVLVENIVCTRVLSKISRTYTEKHGLKELCHVFLKVNLNKASQISDWGQENLEQKQIDYAAKDVVFLYDIFQALKSVALRENRYEVAQAMFKIIPSAVYVEIMNFDPHAMLEH